MSIALRIVGSAPEKVQQEVLAALTARGMTSSSSPHTSQQRVFTLCLEAEDTASLKPLFQSYNYRYVWTGASTTEECVRAVVSHLTGCEDDGLVDLGSASSHHSRFASTRGGASEGETFLSVVRKGLAADGGLYMRKHIPRMPASQLRHFCKTRQMSYIEAAMVVIEQLVDASLPPAVLYPLLLRAYDSERWSGLGDNICPVTPLLLNDTEEGADVPVGEAAWIHDVFLMELYHGPTAAFKDFALQLFPLYFATSVMDAARQEGVTTPSKEDKGGKKKDEYMILAATSGDTGVAAISGFANAKHSTKVMVLYPLHGVSPVQQLQMLSFDDGNNVRVYGLNADFDFCQTTAKTIFSDNALKERLAQMEPARRLSSANSINWGRLIPQVAYYFWAYRQHVHRRKHQPHRAVQWEYGDLIDFVVPCGNFGNILAGYMAKLMGLPVGKLVVASNQNDVLFHFIETGCYDVRNRALQVTASPSIDILKASNVERFLYLLCDGDSAIVANCMRQLDTEGHFTLSPAMFERMSDTFVASRCSEEDCAATIREVYNLSDHRRLIDPHTAVAVYVAKQYRKSLLPEEGAPHPLVIASTAHWAKFPQAVRHAIRGEPMTAEPAESPAAAAKAVQALFNDILSGCDGAGTKPSISVHPSLREALAKKHDAAPREAAAAVKAVVAELEAFAVV